MKRQFVATCYLVFEEKFLLLFHPKFQKWVAPGGHIEENETPPEAARREVREETGLEIEFWTQENVCIDDWNAKSIERPYSCLLENVPAWKDEPPHQHIDFIFVGYPVGGKLNDGRWMTLDEVLALKTHEEIFHDTQAMIQTLSPKSSEIGRREAPLRGS